METNPASATAAVAAKNAAKNAPPPAKSDAGSTTTTRGPTFFLACALGAAGVYYTFFAPTAARL